MHGTIAIDASPSHVNKTAFVVGLGLLLAAGALLRFGGLTERDVWLDESCTYYVVQHLADWPADGPDAVREVAHGPYFLLLWLWTRVFGVTAGGLRSLSAVIGSLTIPVLALVALGLKGRRAGLIAAAMAAVHPLHVYYSQEARAYAMWCAVCAWTLYAVYRAATTLRLRWWAIYGVSAWVLVLTHYYALLWIPASVTVLYVAADRRRGLRQWFGTHLLLALSMAPLIWFVVLPHAQGGPRVWLGETWAAYPPPAAILRSLWALLPAGAYPPYLGALHDGPVILTEQGGLLGSLVVWGPAVLAIVLVLAGGVVYARPVERAAEGERRRGGVGVDPAVRRARLRVVRFVLGMSILFLLIGWVYSALVAPSYVVGRYDLLAWPGVVLGLALLVDAMPTTWHDQPAVHRAVPVLITVAFCICGLLMIGAAGSVPPRQVQAERAEAIAAQVEPTDLVVSMNLYRWFMAYEWDRIGFAPQVLSFPPSHDLQLCWDDAPHELENAEQIAADIEAVTERVTQSLAAGRRVWILAHGEPRGPRWEVDKQFFGRLRELRIEVDLVDESLGLARLVPASAVGAVVGDGG